MTLLTLTEVVGEPRTWSPKDNPERVFNSYKVKDDNGTLYEINRKASSGPPELGQGDYEITPPKEGTSFPPKIKKVFRGGGGGGGMSPERQRAIQRQHSQEMAVRVMDLGGEDPQRATTREDLKNAIQHWADWFDADVNRVAGADVGGGTGGEAAGAARLNTPSAADVSATPDVVAAHENATPADKATTTKKFQAIGCSRDEMRRVVHAIAGSPPTKAGLAAINAAIDNSDWTVLFDDQGIQRPPELPDVRDLAGAVHDDGTILS